jgi:hypothetical protein
MKPMVDRKIPIGLITLAAVAASLQPAKAQDANEATPAVAPGHVTTEPPAQPTAEIRYVTARPPPTVDGYTLEELNVRIRRARIGLYATTGLTVVGIPLMIVGAQRCLAVTDCGGTYRRLAGAGAIIATLGGTGMLVTAIMLGVRKGKRRALERGMRFHSSERRIEWDLATARVVF